MTACVRIIVSLLVLGLIQACSREESLICERNTDYQEAQSAGRLRIPDDLSVPDESDALVVPEPFPPRSEDARQGCLEYSPAYALEEDDEDEEGADE